MDLSAAYRSSRVIEALENYGVSGQGFPETQSGTRGGRPEFMPNEEEFWKKVLQDPNACWNQPFEFFHCVLSEWTPRIPGLYFSKGAAAIRAAADYEIAIKGPKWPEYRPPGKSAKVIGGMGTFLLPPDDEGNLLYSITVSSNASVGIPVLITADIAEQFRLQQGDVLNINKARWVKMSMSWSSRFPSVKGIPNGYLLINKPEQVIKTGIPGLVEFHPCTIMEYQHGDNLLCDYIYVCADSSAPDYRLELERFFEYYRTKEGRNGRYLLACDPAQPMYDAQFSSPAEMKNAPQAAAMKLIAGRIRKVTFNGQTIDNILAAINTTHTRPEDIMGLAERIDVPSNQLTGASAAQLANSLVGLCIDQHKLEELTDLLVMEQA